MGRNRLRTVSVEKKNTPYAGEDSKITPIFTSGQNSQNIQKKMLHPVNSSFSL